MPAAPAIAQCVAAGLGRRYRIRFRRSQSLVLAPPRGLGPCCRLPPGADSGEGRLPDGPSRDAAAGEDSSLIGRRLPVTAPERPAYRGAWPSHPEVPEVDRSEE